MFSAVHLTGFWPGSVLLTGGWNRAAARPWNDDRGEASLRLDRGGARFLAACSDVLATRGASGVASPPLYRPGVWAKAGFVPWLPLDLYERKLSVPISAPKQPIIEGDAAAWQAALQIDNAAFAPLWRLGRAGMEESRLSTPTTIFLVDQEMRGFAIVAYAVGTAYLQRLAVDPKRRGEGAGSALVAAALQWGAARGGRTMLLNTQPDNVDAARLYQRSGFERNPTRLTVYRRGEESEP